VWHRSGISGSLSRYVLKFYADLGYRYLYEIRVSKAGSAKLGTGLYNIYWINSDPSHTEKDISDEMKLLIEKHGAPTRDRPSDFFGKRVPPSLKDEVRAYLLKEYEYEYGAMHAPYKKPTDPAHRTEVLHPLFVRDAAATIKIGHLTDLHVHVRADLYEVNIKRSKIKGVDYNNWNTSSRDLYDRAKGSCDILLLTGDLIDYGRGHFGRTPLSDKLRPFLSKNRELGQEHYVKTPSYEFEDHLGDDALYHQDRNWFLFYEFLASEQAYKKPVYTILGNHDWRVNPYPPFAPGSPSPSNFIHNYEQFFKGANRLDMTEKEHKEWSETLKEVIRDAHGAGYEKRFSYYYDATGNWELIKEQSFWDSVKAFFELVGQTTTLNKERLPTETTIDSVSWYLFLINPFLDFAFHLPGGHSVLMLDWAEEEDVLFPPEIKPVEKRTIEIEGFSFDLSDQWQGYLPWQAGDFTYGGPKARASLTELQKTLVQEFLTRPGTAKMVGIHAPPIGPPTVITDDQLAAHERRQEETNYGTIQRHRDWFINEVQKKESHVRLIFAGHIHRNGLFMLRKPPTGGSLLVRRVEPVPASFADKAIPVYVNTTSAGPKGNLYPKHPIGRSSTQIAKRGEWKTNYAGNYRNTPPGYAEAQLASDGTIQSVEFLSLR
jgi:3',5'-cyclic AMP phosphodiesterase CpdA